MRVWRSFLTLAAGAALPLPLACEDEDPNAPSAADAVRSRTWPLVVRPDTAASGNNLLAVSLAGLKACDSRPRSGDSLESDERVESVGEIVSGVDDCLASAAAADGRRGVGLM